MAGLPDLDIEGRLDEEPYVYPGLGSVSRSRFEELATPLRDLGVTDEWILPGMQFGPFSGAIEHQENRDFLWVFSKIVLIREVAHQRLTEAGVNLQTGPAVMRDRGSKEVRSDYQRVVVTKPVNCMHRRTLEFTRTGYDPKAWAALMRGWSGPPVDMPEYDYRECSECGLKIGRRPMRLCLREASIPDGASAFFVQETQQVVITGDLAEAIRKLRLTNILLEPAEVLS